MTAPDPREALRKKLGALFDRTCLPDRMVDVVTDELKAALAQAAPPPERGLCWFCKGTFVVDALIAGYDTFDEQRLACLACNERIQGKADASGWVAGHWQRPARPDTETAGEAG